VAEAYDSHRNLQSECRRLLLRRSRVQNGREIHRKTDLAADPRAGRVPAAQQRERKTQAIANRVLAATHALQNLGPGLKVAFG